MPAGPAPGIRHSWHESITARLIVVYIASAAVLLAASTIVLTVAFSSIFTAESHKFLSDKLDLLRIILREFPETERSRQEEIQLNWSAFRKWKSYARVLDEDGTVLIETPRPNDIAWPPAADAAAHGQPARIIEQGPPYGRRIIIASSREQFGHHPRLSRTLQVALDVTDKHATIASYQRMALLSLLAGIALAAALAVWLVRRGMRPLWGITQAAQSITAQQLHERLQLARLPTELYELATAFNAMLARLEDSFARLSQFSDDIAHELRTPINNLMGEAEVALGRARTADEYAAVIESSIEEYRRLARMIDSLLFLARAENAETTVEKAPLDACAEVTAVIDFYEAIAEEQGVTMACEGDASVRADPVLFRRAVSNLFSNALRYTPAGGSILATTTVAGDGAVSIRIADTGAGIAAEHLPRIFDRFYMADKARHSGPYQGTGLGLSIVKSIMDLHGGIAVIESQQGKFTAVTLTFPA